MKNTIWHQKIPTLFALLLLIIGISVTALLVNKGVIFIGHASPSEIPENIRITNIKDSSFSATYTTTDSVSGVMVYGSNKSDLNQSAQDDRDKQPGQLSLHTVHHITAKNLQPKTQYFFSINSGQNMYLNNNEPFSTTTGAKIESEISEKTITGKVILSDGNPLSEGLLYIKTPTSQTASTTTKETGEYTFSLSLLRKSDLSTYESFAIDKTMQILIKNNLLQSTIVASSAEINPMPTVILSNNYDFTENAKTIATGSTESLFPIFSTNISSSSAHRTPDITNPKTNQTFVDTQPVFKGVAQPDAIINITIHSVNEIKSEVTTDKNGNWSFRPSTPLTPGEHTISIVTRDQFNILKTITKSFTVFAAGTQVAQSATPSATITPSSSPVSPTPTTSPTIQPTIILSPTPSLVLSPTPTPMIIVTPTPRVILSPTHPPTKGKISPPGSSFITLMLLSVGITLTGMILFLLSRPNSHSL